MLIRIATPETKYSSKITFYLGGIKRIHEDNSFDTVCQGLGRPNQFGRVDSAEAYRAYPKKDEVYANLSTVKPLNDYEVFELTDNPKECNLLRIAYYMGHDYMNVVEVVSDKVFVVAEKLYIKGGREANEGKGSCNPENNGVNRILNIMGLEHYPTENPRYEGDCNTAIGLMPDCKYEMYKLVKKVLVVSK